MAGSKGGDHPQRYANLQGAGPPGGRGHDLPAGPDGRGRGVEQNCAASLALNTDQGPAAPDSAAIVWTMRPVRSISR